MAFLLLAALLAASRMFAQAFVAEWTAAAQGGVGPTGLLLATEGGTSYLYVADHPRGRLLKFNTATGTVAATIGKQGTANGDFNAPYGLARDPASGDIYVAERGNHRISRVTSAGTFVMAWGTPGTGPGQFNEPVGVAVDAAGDVYVTDHGNNRVQKFRVVPPQAGGAWTASHLATWGSAGSGNGQFNQPYGITADSAGNIWVADGFNGRVQRFNASGAYQSTLGSAGTGPGQFIVATWLGVHPGGDLLVTSTNSNPQDGALADASNQWVSRFTAAGAFVSRWGGAYGSGPGQFKLPFCAVVDASNRAYVSDYYNTRIQVFDLNAAPTTGGGTTGGGTTGGGTTGGGTTGGADTTPPAIASFTTGATTATSVTYTLTFSESVTGVNSADFTAVAAGGATATIGTVAGSGATYSIPVTFNGTGTVRLDLNATGTGIADAAGNALATGATGPVYTISTGGTGGGTTGGGTTSGGGTTGGGTTGGGSTTTGTRVVGVTVPANGIYGKGEELIFTVRFSGNVTVSAPRSADLADDKDDKKDKPGDKDDKDSKPVNPTTPTRTDDDDDDDEEDEAEVYFTWTAVGASERQKDASGKVAYKSGSGTSTLTFRYKVHNGDLAPAGIRLGTALQLGDGATLRDAAGRALVGDQLALPWPQNPLTGVILNAPKPGVGNGGVAGNSNAGGNGNGHGRGRDRLVNLSSRLRVTGGDASRSVVAGFVVTGSAPKPILIRAVGPGLAAFGIRDGLASPRLELRDSAGKLIAGNDGWNNRVEITIASDQVGAFRLAPGSRDAALLAALMPGAYTVQVAANGNGIVLVEVYDASNGSQLDTEQIVNISTRGFIGTDDDVLVAGFVVTGNAPRRVLIRGIGPGLAAFGVTGTVADPVLKLFRAGAASPMAQNDNWGTPQPVTGAAAPATAAEITAATTAAGGFPLAAGSKDAALVVTLPPGNYSAIVSGANNGTGAGLVEIYELP